jgi:4-oxalocrotonate tautomerase
VYKRGTITLLQRTDRVGRCGNKGYWQPLIGVVSWLRFSPFLPFKLLQLNAYKEIPVPYVNIQITKGATRDQKAQLVKEVTASLVRILGKKPEHTHIVIQEIADEDWGFSGLLTDDWKKQQAPQSPTET